MHAEPRPVKGEGGEREVREVREGEGEAFPAFPWLFPARSRSLAGTRRGPPSPPASAHPYPTLPTSPPHKFTLAPLSSMSIL